MNDDTLIYFGGEVKAIGEYKFRGELCLHTTHVDPDLTKDYFDRKTDFDLEPGDSRSGYYSHGLDLKIGNRKIGRGTFVRDEVALWVEGQLAERDDYIDSINEMIKRGELGLSSGAVSHLVRREKVGKSYHITNWPIGEWSLTPTPAEPRTQAISLKSLVLDELPLAGKTFQEHSDSVLAAVEEWIERCEDIQSHRIKSGRQLSQTNRARLQQIHDHIMAGAGHVASMLADNNPSEDAGKSVIALQQRLLKMRLDALSV